MSKFPINPYQNYRIRNLPLSDDAIRAEMPEVFSIKDWIVTEYVGKLTTDHPRLDPAIGDNYSRTALALYLVDSGNDKPRLQDVGRPGIGTFLDYEEVTDIAAKLGIKPAPVICVGNVNLTQLLQDLRSGELKSRLADQGGEDVRPAEGIVARSVPTLYTQEPYSKGRGERVIWQVLRKNLIAK